MKHISYYSGKDLDIMSDAEIDEEIRTVSSAFRLRSLGVSIFLGAAVGWLAATLF